MIDEQTIRCMDLVEKCSGQLKLSVKLNQTQEKALAIAVEALESSLSHFSKIGSACKNQTTDLGLEKHSLPVLGMGEAAFDRKKEILKAFQQIKELTGETSGS